jgi:hypothetical protein
MDETQEIVLRMLALVEKLAEQLSPVEVIRALQGPPVAPAPVQVPWADDTPHAAPPGAEDPWGDPHVTFEDAVAAMREGGWVDPPFTEEGAPDAGP